MKYQPLLPLSAALFAGGVLLHALPAAAGAADALVSKSYALGTYLRTVQTQAAAAADAVFAQTVIPQLAAAEQAHSASAMQAALADQVVQAVAKGDAAVTETLTQNAAIVCQTGAELSLISGDAVVTAGAFINLSAGKAVSVGETLTRSQVYLAADDGAAIRMTAAGTVRLSGLYRKGQAAGESGSTGVAQYTAYADALCDLGLFQGSSKGYELTRTATRAEGVVMLIRLLGKEDAALAYRGDHPFTDVPAWAQPYVAYAYAKGYASGISSDTFGTTIELRYRDYMTFLLRALGYDDSKGEFAWTTADQTAVRVGIQTEAERAAILSSGRFLRDHVAYTSYRALFAVGKDGEQLAERLIDEGMFSRSELRAVQGL